MSLFLGVANGTVCRNPKGGMIMKYSRSLIDDGYHAELVETAFFDGIMEIPRIVKPEKISIPEGMVPFSCRKKSDGHKQFLCFYEHDFKVSNYLTSIDSHLDDIKKFAGIVSPDCSLYIDMPLCLQIANIYMNRAYGHYLQSKGIYVVPNIRWGDERTFTTVELPEKVAFLGVDKYSIVSVGTHGQVREKTDKYYFREGLIAMLDSLEPEVVLVYGPKTKQIFEGLEGRTHFVFFPDWVTRVHGGDI